MTKEYRDYSGIATHQLAEVFMRLKHPLERLENVAEHMKMDPRDLRRIVVGPNYEFTGLDLADRLFLAIGENVSVLSHLGEVTIIPANETVAAVKMAQDALWARDYDEDPDPDEVAEEALRLADLRRETIKAYGKDS